MRDKKTFKTHIPALLISDSRATHARRLWSKTLASVPFRNGLRCDFGLASAYVIR